MADRLEIIDALESLAVHCRLPIMDIDGKSRWLQTWCEDLRAFDADAIRTACRNWRQGENIKFPTPGQLLPMVRSASKLRPERVFSNAPWTWPSDDELASLPMHERRRQYLIMAQEARSKAGPMDANGVIPRPEWIEQARSYADEAARLRADITRNAQRADF